jgi:IS5 family transposase
MERIDSFFLKMHYDSTLSEKDKLKKLNNAVDWDKFRPIIGDLYNNKSSSGGRPNIDIVVMVKCMVLQTLFGLSDEALEYNLNDRISFRMFIGLDQKVPDFTTFWRFKERIGIRGIENKIQEELDRQICAKGFIVKKGVIQDASIIESDIGKHRKAEEDKNRKRGKTVKYTERQKSHIDKDASFVKKGKKAYHGYKLHIKTDIDHGFIRKFDTTTASVHDSQIDLVEEGDNLAARDKGYFGVPLKCEGVRDYTMQRAVRGRPLTEKEKWRNKIISKVRILVERPFAVIKRVFGRNRTNAKRLRRVHVQQLFNCFTYNLLNLVYREKSSG